MRTRTFVYDPKLRPPPSVRPLPSGDRVIAFIKAELAAGRKFPTSIQIAQHMGWKHANSAMDCLFALVARGRLKVQREEEPTVRGRRYRYHWELAA